MSYFMNQNMNAWTYKVKKQSGKNKSPGQMILKVQEAKRYDKAQYS